MKMKVPKPKMPRDLEKALRAAPKARALWGDITPFARRDWILWITSARRPETSARRIDKACAMLAFGKRRVCCFGGINWLIKMNAANLPAGRQEGAIK